MIIEIIRYFKFLYHKACNVRNDGIAAIYMVSFILSFIGLLGGIGALLIVYPKIFLVFLAYIIFSNREIIGKHTSKLWKEFREFDKN